MKLVKCSSCGSTDLVENNGIVVCVYCRSKYASETGGVKPRETIIGVASDIQALLQKCKEDPINRQRFANLILDLDPSNKEVKQYIS